MTNSVWWWVGAAHGNNCRGLLIALGEADASALWPCRLSQGARERAIEISAFSCSCRGSTDPPTNGIDLRIMKMRSLWI